MAAGAVVLASAAMTANAENTVAEGFTVTKNFFHEFDATGNIYRTGMGVN